ncbi:MAG: MMPL family transporter [Ilumatobacteraceae bacterium]
MLTRLGRFTVRRRRLVLALTATFMVVAAVLGTRAFGVLTDGGFDDPGSQSARADALLDEHFGAREPNVVLVVTATAGDVDAPGVTAAAAELVDTIAGVDDVDDVTSYWDLGSTPTLRSLDGDRALVFAVAAGDDDREEAAIERVRTIAADAPPAITVAVGGSDAAGIDIGTTIEGDLARAELIAVPVTLLLLLLVFGGLVAAALPLLVGAIAVLGTFLSLFVIGSLTDVSIFSINLTTALGLGLAIDYSLFIVSRYREELGAGRTVESAVVRAVETAGRTVTISALTVAVSLAALLVFPQYFLRSFAYAGIAVVVLAMVGAVVALPALLAVVGTRIDALRVLPRRARRVEHDGFWYRTARRVMRRPVLVAAGVVVLLLLLGSPFLRVRFGTPDDRVLPETAPARIANEQLRADFAGNAGESFPVVIDGAPGNGPPPTADVDALAGAISALDGVARVDGPGGTFVGGQAAGETDDGPALFTDDDVVRLAVTPAIEIVSPEGESLIAEIRDVIDDATTPLDAAVGGQTAQLVDTKSSIAARLPLALALIVVATAVLLFVLSGSVLVPIKALVLNALSLTATFGAMVWIFQDGNLSGLFDFTATGTIDTTVPILMFCIAFGLSMDYEVFMLSRIEEEHDRTGDNDEAVALGLERTGRIVTAAAVLLSVTFFAFATSGVSFIVMFGLGLGLAVLMDAFVIRGTLVPAFMTLAGEANWWAPGPLRRLHRRLGIRDGEHQPSEPTGTTADAADPGAAVDTGHADDTGACGDDEGSRQLVG